MSAELELVQLELAPLRKRLAETKSQIAKWMADVNSGKPFYHHMSLDSARARKVEIEKEIKVLELRERGIIDRIQEADNERQRQNTLLREERERSAKDKADALARAEADKFEASQKADAERREAAERAENEKNAAVEAAIAKTKEEDRSFWFRRFHTSLALAHGAGFAAVSSKLFDASLTPVIARGAFYPLVAFALGMSLAGLIPIALFREAPRPAWALAITSALLFLTALAATLIAVGTAARLL